MSPKQRFIKEATADKDRFLEYRNPQGQIMYSAYTALPTGWIIVAAASKEAMLAGVRNLRSDIILSCVGALLLVTLLIYLILRKVTGVLQEGVGVRRARSLGRSRSFPKHPARG